MLAQRETFGYGDFSFNYDAIASRVQKLGSRMLKPLFFAS